MRTLLLLWTLPILIGALAAAGDILRYRMLGEVPGLESGLTGFLIFLVIVISSGWSAWVLAMRMRRWLKSAGIQRPAIEKFNVFATGVAGLVSLCYVFWRSASVNSSLVSQLGYCCCCESLPEAAETLVRVFNPFSV
jgi:hypothetical protein